MYPTSIRCTAFDGATPIEFDEKLWHAVVERLTVYNDDRLVYSLKDGTEITVML